MNNIYIDDSVYGDSIGLHDIYLFSGMRHVLNLKSYPDPDVPEYVLNCDQTFVSKDGNSIVIDLTGIEENIEFDIEIVYGNNVSDKRKIHTYPPKTLADFAGTYRCEELPGRPIELREDGTMTIDLDDRVDGLEPFVGKVRFNPYTFGFEVIENFPVQVSDETEYSLYIYISAKPGDFSLNAAVALIASDGYNAEHYFMIGDGDEDGVYLYDVYKKVS